MGEDPELAFEGCLKCHGKCRLDEASFGVADKPRVYLGTPKTSNENNPNAGRGDCNERPVPYVPPSLILVKRHRCAEDYAERCQRTIDEQKQ